MNILHTVQFYSPSVGGAQEVVRQISEQLVKRGHTVTVATSFHPARRSLEINGVRIEQFNISGNFVKGFWGEVDRYREFLYKGSYDLMMNYAAQQWATDLVFPELNRLPYKKILIPCGFSALYDPNYAAYFADMHAVMRRYDHLIFHADHYRDTDLAREKGLSHWSIIPNGALWAEFEQPNPDFRKRFGIPADVPLLLTIGTHTGLKGHRLVLEAFQRLKIARAVLVIIGNSNEPASLWRHAFRPLLGALKRRDASRFGEIIKLTRTGCIGAGCLPDCRARATTINRQSGNDKRVLLLDLPRADVISALQAADLFLFGSNIEYSPLVLFEAMAAGTPFLTLACGNAFEIVEWSDGGGKLAPTLQKEQGLVDSDPDTFANSVGELLSDPQHLETMGKAGYAAWKAKFTWERIVVEYETKYLDLLK